MRKIIMSGVTALAAAAGLMVPAATGSAAAAPAVPALRAAVRPPAAPFRTGMAPSRMAAGAVALIFQGGEISCGTAKTCLSVGTSINASTGNAIPSVRAWRGSAWRSVSVHAPKGTTFQTMAGVSCKTASYCLMIGSDTSGASGAFRPFALAWTGTAVSAVPVPPVPRGSVDTELVGVTCVAVKKCVAAGTSMAKSGAATMVFETWNGARWTLRTAKGPAGSTQVLLAGASCVSLSYCVLAGTAFPPAGASRPYLAGWNGKAWAAQRVPAPAAGKSSVFDGVSCLSAAYCVATGQTGATNANASTPIAGFWNGSAWKVTAG